MEELPVYIPMLSLLVLWLLQYVETARLHRKLDDQQRQLDELRRSFDKGEAWDEGLDLPKETKERVLQLARKGKKIQAIKELKEAIGLGLKEAKAYVDRLCPPFGNID